MNENWTEHDDCVTSGLSYLGSDPDDTEGSEDTMLLTPVNVYNDSAYGIYFDSNPAIVFAREHLDTVLDMSPAEAIAWLMAEVTDAQRHMGEPFYVKGARG